MILIAELKRRNVIRMAGLYMVGAWLITQVAGTVLPMFGAPEWIARSVVVLLAIGLVPALAFAWAFEMTPAGLKRDTEVDPAASMAPQTARRMNRLIVAVLALAVTFFGFDRLVLAPRRDAALVVATTQTVKAAAATASAPVVDPRSIAVLPFVNMSEDKDNEYFSDGISEELLNVLVRVEGLGVASRTSSFAFKGKDIAASAIAGQLKVRYILEGSVRKQGGNVRITAQLIDASDDRHAWSQTYDRQLTDIFKIQDDIANAIVAAVRGTLGKQPEHAVSVRADTDNMQAYELYLKARELFIARSDLLESVRLFERTVGMDPQFARGWEGLAAVSSVIESWGFDDRDYTALARTAAERALKLDPSLSMPWAALAQTQKAKWPVDHDKLQQQLGKAIAADPRNATALLWRGIAWTELGFFNRALADLDLCLKLEPGYHNCRSHRMLALLSRGDETAAIDEFNRSVANGAATSRVENLLATLVHRGNDTAALLIMDSWDVPIALRPVLLAALRHPSAKQTDATDMIKQHLSDPDNRALERFGLSHFYFWFGDYDRVADVDSSKQGSMIAWDRYPASFRNSSQMKRRLVNEGVVAYWRKHGFPPVCRPVGASDFICDAISAVAVQ